MGDQRLVCRDCGAEFVITAGEQLFYEDRGLSLPTRCADCRALRRAQRLEDGGRSGAGDDAGWRIGLEAPAEFGIGGDRGHRGRDDAWGSQGPRRLFTAFCDECGRETEVPFRPRGDRPVYCRECYNARRGR